MAKTRIAAIAAAVLGLTALAAPPAGAAARPGYEVRPGGLESTIFLLGANDHLIIIGTKGHRQVELTATRDLFTGATYKTTGRVSRRGIEADFGELGRISVRFDGKRIEGGSLFGPDVPGRRCRGKDPVSLAGRFRGTIEFRGENGYTSVDVKSTGGLVSQSFRQVCRRRGSASGPDAPPPRRLKGKITVLTARKLAGHGRRVSFTSVGLRLGALGDLVIVGATLNERGDGMRIVRGASELGDEALTLVSPPGRTPVQATVALPPPFEGSAEYLDQEGAPPTWTGSLAARLAGAGLVPLTGEGFRASLCRAPLRALFEDGNPCLSRAGIGREQAKQGSPVAARLQRIIRRGEL